MITLIIILIAALMILMLSTCKVAGKADEDAERMYAEYVPTTPEPTPEPSSEPIPDDVLLLAKVMQTESGVNWADWACMLIGEVVMNRVESWRFPNSVREVVYQNNPVQYEPVYAPGWEDIEPESRYVDLAWRLMNGERPLGDPEMVFQSLFPQGTETLVTYYDSVLDTRTYFCRG